MKRTFIAIDIPYSKDIKDCISVFANTFQNEKIKWIDADNLHLTLKFLGDTQENKIEAITSRLKEIGSQQIPFEVIVKNAGVFKNISHPAIIWIGIEESKPLTFFKNQIDLCLTDYGFQPEERKFSPHLTIGRVKILKDKSALQQLLNNYHNKTFIRFSVSEVIFYESILDYKGPRYIILGRLPLREG